MLRVGNRSFNGLPGIGTFYLCLLKVKAQLGIKMFYCQTELLLGNSC